MTQQKLILMVGLPGSGKSTTGFQLAQESRFTYVSRDYVRNFLDLGQTKPEHKITKNVFMGLIEASLFRKESVIADATHLNEGSRKPLIELGKKYGAKIETIVMNTSYETCIVRNGKRDEDEKVPNKVIRGMAESMTKPSESEGFNKVHLFHEGAGINGIDD